MNILPAIRNTRKPVSAPARLEKRMEYSWISAMIMMMSLTMKEVDIVVDLVVVVVGVAVLFI